MPGYSPGFEDVVGWGGGGGGGGGVGTPSPRHLFSHGATYCARHSAACANVHASYTPEPQ